MMKKNKDFLIIYIEGEEVRIPLKPVRVYYEQIARAEFVVKELNHAKT